MNAVFAILSVQASIGAFDNLWHHELEAKLPQHLSARYELVLDASREAIYAVLFLGPTRRQPKLERVLHTILAVSYGAFVAAFAPEMLA